MILRSGIIFLMGTLLFFRTIPFVFAALGDVVSVIDTTTQLEEEEAKTEEEEAIVEEEKEAKVQAATLIDSTPPFDGTSLYRRPRR